MHRAGRNRTYIAFSVKLEFSCEVQKVVNTGMSRTHRIIAPIFYQRPSFASLPDFNLCTVTIGIDANTETKVCTVFIVISLF